MTAPGWLRRLLREPLLHFLLLGGLLLLAYSLLNPGGTSEDYPRQRFDVHFSNFETEGSVPS